MMANFYIYNVKHTLLRNNNFIIIKKSIWVSGKTKFFIRVFPNNINRVIKVLDAIF